VASNRVARACFVVAAFIGLFVEFIGFVFAYFAVTDDVQQRVPAKEINDVKAEVVLGFLANYSGS
jgi:hypothetical protein